MASFPLKKGAMCGWCAGPCNVFGCANECAEFQQHRLQWPDRTPNDSPEDQLADIKAICVNELLGVRPEFVSPALVRIARILGVNAQGEAGNGE